MQAENRLGSVGTIQDTFLDHHYRTPVFAGRRAFLGRLEDELDGSRQHLPVIRQDFGGTHEHGDVGVMAARVHDRDILSVVFATCPGGKRNTGTLEHRQAIHIGPQGNHRTRFAAHQRADHAGVCNAGLHLVEAEISQVPGDFRCRLELTIREFRILMDIAPPFDDFRFYGRKGIIQIVFRILRHRGHAQHEQRETTWEVDCVHGGVPLFAAIRDDSSVHGSREERF